jgi:hypothetical protein
VFTITFQICLSRHIGLGKKRTSSGARFFRPQCWKGLRKAKFIKANEKTRVVPISLLEEIAQARHPATQRGPAFTQAPDAASYDAHRRRQPEP